MAEETKDKEAQPTERVVLTSFDLPFDQVPERVQRHFRGKKPEQVEVWVTIGRIHTGSKSQVIHAAAAAAAKPPLKEAPGSYRAPSASAWRGGELLREPAQMALERQSLD